MTAPTLRPSLATTPSDWPADEADHGLVPLTDAERDHARAGLAEYQATIGIAPAATGEASS